MLSIYGKNSRPQAELDAIIAATEGFEERTLRKWQRISTENNENIHFIVSGEVEFRRESDELCMFTLQNKCIFGLSSIYYNSTHMYGLVRASTVVRTLKKEDFFRLMSEKKPVGSLE